MTAGDRSEERAGGGTAPGKTALVEVDDLRVHFGGVKALDGVTLTLWQGECCGLIGANGSGKSTLLAALSRLHHGDERGDIRLGGVSCTSWAPDRIARWGLARTFQTVRLVPDLTVLENVMAGGMSGSRSGHAAGPQPRRRRHREADLAARARRALETAGVADVAAMHPGQLPYGLQRRVEVARAIVSLPRLLLLDEPTAGMTVRERGELGELFVELAEAGMSVFVVEHDVQFVTNTCRRAFALDFGKVVASGTPAEVVASPEVQRAYLGSAPGSGRPPAPSAQVQA